MPRERFMLMATFTRSDELQGAQFVDADLRGARFVRADLSGVVMRGVKVAEADIDAPWLPNGRVLARQRRRRDPARRGRAQPPLSRPRRKARRRSGRPARGLGHARAHLGGHARARRGDAGRHGRRSVDGEWSFAQTLRHLVLATDMWLGRAILRARKAVPPPRPDGRRQRGGRRPGHVGLRDGQHRRTPKCSRHGRVASRWCATSSPRSPQTSWPRRAQNPHAPEHPETTLSCLHVILEEEWEHHRYAIRDLDTIDGDVRA